jgi:DNA-directed RNA polymerase subunit M/transcription elongation factor TFIIS
MEVGVRYEADLIQCQKCEHKWLGYIHIDVIDWGNGLIEESRAQLFECPKCGLMEGIIYEND